MKTISKLFYTVFILMICCFILSCKSISVQISSNKLVISEEVDLPLELENISLNELTFTYDDTIISVENGKIYPLKAGKTSIEIKSGDRAYGTITVIVKQEFDDLTLVVGDTFEITESIFDYTYTTKSDIIAIDDSTIIALKEGTASVVATSADDFENNVSFLVTVTKKAQSMTIENVVDSKIELDSKVDLQFNLEGITLDEVTITSDSECVDVDGITLIPNYAGTANITVTAGELSQVFIAYVLPQISVTAYVGRAVTIEYLNVDNPDDFNIEYDQENFKLDEGQIIATKIGNYSFVFTSNINPSIKAVVDFTVKAEPIEIVDGNIIRLGEELRLAFANYDISLFTITNTTLDIVSYDAALNKVVGLKEGTAVFKAVDINGNAFTFELKVLPEDPIITYDLTEVTLESWLEFSIENYDDFSMFTYEMDNEIIEIDEDYFGYAFETGIVNITFIHKEYPSVKTTIKIEVLPEVVRAKLNAEMIKVGEVFNVELNYQDHSLFDISFNSEILKYENGSFTAVSPGETSIIYTLKEDARIQDEVSVIVYPVKPIIQIANTELTIGKKIRIDVPNYRNDEYTITLSDQTIGEMDDNLFQSLAIGECTITVTLNDSSESSSVTVAVLPIMPNAQLSSKYLLPNSKSTLFILNYEEVNATSLADFTITVLDNSIVKNNGDGTFTALKVGSTKILVSLINDSGISKEVDITVCNPNEVSNGEPTNGPLILSLPEDAARVHAGDMVYLNLAYATNYEKYTWVSSDSKVAIVNEKGRVIGVEAGIVTISAYNTNDSSIIGSITLEVYGIPNVDYIGRIIKIAEAEIGFVEGPDNDTKYGAWYGLNNAAWCAMFVSWCANQAGIGTDIIPKYASVSIGMEWFVERGLFQYKENYTPKAGDIIIFKSDGASHTGIVIACEGGTVYTIEGNTANSVKKRSYELDFSQITGYGTPEYPHYNGEVEGGDTGGSSSGEGESTT